MRRWQRATRTTAGSRGPAPARRECEEQNPMNTARRRQHPCLPLLFQMEAKQAGWRRDGGSARTMRLRRAGRGDEMYCITARFRDSEHLHQLARRRGGCVAGADGKLAHGNVQRQAPSVRPNQQEWSVPRYALQASLQVKQTVMKRRRIVHERSCRAGVGSSPLADGQPPQPTKIGHTLALRAEA
ncbi:hypothetical protein CPLU01_00288 [Colletotrichum plurivorum]|uniref:Uncharacterized protein n=1 Tax=Colletotrichum plurivorum TaxID=2175906 RepID=A0A8H6U619_9PEZI|nr:hypothetical protein CPLU01_00288 [Colletotrichum plurivorum]